MIFDFMKRRRRRLLRDRIVEDRSWTEAVTRQSGLLRGIDADALARLREIVTVFLAGKRFLGAHGLETVEDMRLDIALPACLLVLELGIDWYDDWTTVIVYPGEYYPHHEELDMETGVVHVDDTPWIGESWEGGPLLLSWADVEESCRHAPPHLVIHEFAHKLDMRDGTANGRPPLHPGMDGERWKEAFLTAWEDIRLREQDGRETPIDPYAASDPAEFFAVACEWFFTAPATLHTAWPRVYEQLALFFRQEPLRRQEGPGGQI